MEDKNFLNALDDWGSILTDTYEANSVFKPKTYINASTGEKRIAWKTYFNSGTKKTLKFDDDIKVIEQVAFCESNFIGPLILPKELNKIQCGAFRGCKGFTGDLILPNTVNRVADFAFTDCSGFDGQLKLSTHKYFTSIGWETFKGCSGLTGTLEIPSNIIHVGQSSFSGCSGFNKLLIQNGVKHIFEAAFKDCSNLEGDVIIPPSIKSISKYAFSGCEKLKTIFIPLKDPIYLYDKWNSGCPAEIKYYNI